MKYDGYIGKGFHRWAEGKYPPEQLKAINDHTSPNLLCSGSYRSGKTEGAVRKAVRHIKTFDNAKLGVFRKNLASIKLSTMITLLELVHPSWVKDWSNDQLILTLKNGSTAIFKGLVEPEKMGSFELTMGLIDEASEVTPEAIGMIQGRLSGALVAPENYDPADYEYIQQSLKSRQLILATNPKSSAHHLYKDFIELPKPSYHVYHSNSIQNPNLPFNYLRDQIANYVRPGYTIDWVVEQVKLIREGLADRTGHHLIPALTPFGQRNLLGLWVALEGAIYDLDKAHHFIDELPQLPLEFSVCGLDLGYHNPRVLVLNRYTMLGKSFYVAVEGWHKPEATRDDIVDKVVALDKKYSFRKVFVPHDGPDVKKMLRSKLSYSRVKSAKTDVLPGINVVDRFLKERLKIYSQAPDADLLWSELEGYCWKKNREGEALDEPLKENDHYPDSLRYILYSLHYKDL